MESKLCVMKPIILWSAGMQHMLCYHNGKPNVTKTGIYWEYLTLRIDSIYAKYALDIQLIYQTEIHGFAGYSK